MVCLIPLLLSEPQPHASGIWLLGVKEGPWKRVFACCLVDGCLGSAGLTTGARGDDDSQPHWASGTMHGALDQPYCV